MNNNLEPVELRNEVMSDEPMETTDHLAVESVQAPPAKKVKKERDPNQPKKPLNNYFLFQRDFRARFKESHPTATSAELNKAMTESWTNISKEEAQYYEILAKEHQSAYMKALEEYKKKSSTETLTETIEPTELTELTEPTGHSEDFSTVITVNPYTTHTTHTTHTLAATPVDINMTSSDAEAPKKKKKKNKEKREKSSQE